MNADFWCGLFAEHLEVLNYSKQTVYSYGLEVRQFCEFLGGRGVEQPSEVRREDVTAYQLLLHHRRKPDGKALTASTRCFKIGAALLFLRFLYEKGFTVADPGRHVKRPRRPDSLPPDTPDEEQVLKLLEQPDTSSHQGKRDRALLELLYSSALRNAETRALRISDIDLHRLEVTVNSGKGNKGRRVPLSEAAAVWLEEYLVNGRPVLERELADDTLFLNSRGRPLRGETLSDMVRGYAEKAELPMKVTPHILRHACATHMLSRQAGIRQLQKFLGHACAGSTERYTRVEVSDLREVMLRCHPRESC